MRRARTTRAWRSALIDHVSICSLLCGSQISRCAGQTPAMSFYYEQKDRPSRPGRAVPVSVFWRVTAARTVGAVPAAAALMPTARPEGDYQPEAQGRQDQKLQHRRSLLTAPGRCGTPAATPPRRWRTGPGPHRRPSGWSPAPASRRRWPPRRGCTAA